MWYELQIENCPQKQIEDLMACLEEDGASSISLTDKNDDPILEPALGSTPLWPEVIVTALYPEESLAKKALFILKEKPALKLKLTTFNEQDWVHVCMQDFKPLQFGNLWICPNNEEKKPSPSLILPPGLAFGTGSHETT